ncbi:MAG: lantibiotic immunity ABC transporter MutG family permease subunit [Velocimicrobium sp.]
MVTFIRCIRSDCYKFKHTSMLLIHGLIPLGTALLFLGYYSTSSWKVDIKISGFLEVLSISFPLIIGLICSKAIEQEGQAGGFQVMLCNIKSRTVAYASKLALLLLLGTCSIALAVLVFALGFKAAPGILYLKAVGILVAGNFFLYILHQFVSFQYGRGASIGLGIAESLISALALTGLGDGKWYYIPCAWSVRLNDYLVYIWVNPSSTAIGNAEIEKGLLIALLTSCIALFVSFLWFQNWEGRKTYE